MSSALTPVPQPPESFPDDVVSLVLAAQGGDRRAYGVLYHRFGRFIYGVVLAHAHDDDVADTVHDVFLQAMSKLHTLREPAAFGKWLARIAQNMTRKKRRRKPELVPLNDQLPAPCAAAVEPAMDGATVLAAIRKLPKAYREVLVLRFVERMSAEEIAERTGLTSGSVRVTLSRGKTMLRIKLGGAQ